MLTDIDVETHERVVSVKDDAAGLNAIIAIHSTALGPAGGGCRLWTYGSDELALQDALKLSQGMSYKNAMAGIPLGGGKAVIQGPISAYQRKQVFAAFGRAVDALGGAYITAEDVGVRVVDMLEVASQTAHVSGLRASNGIGGDPSPFTARGVFYGIKAAVERQFGTSDLTGLRVAVQGLGGVGGNLCHMLAAQGAEVLVHDINDAAVTRICDAINATPFEMEGLTTGGIDVFSPCALGGVINEDRAKTLAVKIVAGGANNQLLTANAGDILHERDILYAPDYVINAGGIIVVDAEYRGVTDERAVFDKIEDIGGRLGALFTESKDTNRPTHKLADDRAKEIIAASTLAGPQSGYSRQTYC